MSKQTRSHGRYVFRIVAVILFALPMGSWAVTYIHPTIPGTDADDPTQGGMAIDGNRAYATISLSGAEDPSKSGYIREGDEWVETMPMSTARRFGGRRFNVTGSNGQQVVPMPVETRHDDDFNLRQFDEFE